MYLEKFGRWVPLDMVNVHKSFEFGRDSTYSFHFSAAKTLRTKTLRTRHLRSP